LCHRTTYPVCQCDNITQYSARYYNHNTRLAVLDQELIPHCALNLLDRSSKPGKTFSSQGFLSGFAYLRPHYMKNASPTWPPKCKKNPNPMFSGINLSIFDFFLRFIYGTLFNLGTNKQKSLKGAWPRSRDPYKIRYRPIHKHISKASNAVDFKFGI